MNTTLNASPALSDAEIDGLCEGLTQNAARIRYLRSLGLTVNTKPNGRPLVMRAHAERVLAGEKVPAEAANDTPRQALQPNRAGLVQLFGPRAA
jgi:hypothetical protein